MHDIDELTELEQGAERKEAGSGTARTVAKRARAKKAEADLVARATAAAGGIREELVEEISSQIRDGTYSPPSTEVAEGILTHLEEERSYRSLVEG
ncbi:MAG: flagellar biosynthesis anti-sigma factor FlgM [Armatimonadota bacterium]